jgi:hypothetical protein
MSRQRTWVSVGTALVVLAGCVTAPPPAAPAPPLPDTTVYFYPTHDQSAEQQDRDKYECNKWAVEKSGFDPSAPTVPPHLRVLVEAGPPPGSGVVTGAVVGAVIGASVSHPWEAGRGSVLGALAGAVIGGAAQSAANANAAAANSAAVMRAQAAALEEQARNFRRAMSACLEGRGYNVR